MSFICNKCYKISVKLVYAEYSRNINSYHILTNIISCVYS